MTSLRSISVPPAHIHSPASTSQPDYERDESQTAQTLLTLWGKKWVILAAILLATALGALYAFHLAVPLYTTAAVLTLEPSADPVSELPDVMAAFSGDSAVVNTELEILRSRGLMRELVRKLGLTDDPEFNPELRESYLNSLEKLTPEWLVEWLSPNHPDMGTFGGEQVVVDATVTELEDAISVANVRDTYVFQVWVTSQSPAKSLRIANTLTDLYIANRMQNKFEATEEATSWLTDRVRELKAELQEAETVLKEFTSTTDLVGPEHLELLNRQLKDLRDRHAEVAASAEDIAASLERVERLGSGATAAAIAEAAQEPRVSEAAKRFEAGILERAEFDAQLDRILQQFRIQLARDQDQTTSLAKAITELEKTVEHQSSELVLQQQLEREVEATALVYETLLARLKEVSLRHGAQESDARVVTTAPLPTEPSSPKIPLVLALSAMVGAFAGAGLVLGRERMQNTFRTAEELERVTGETVLGEIPVAPTRNRKKLLAHLISRRESPFSEAVRGLRTSILLTDAEQAPQVILITSSVPEEGKTTQSLGLAYNFSALGKKVLLIEADVRRRPLSEYVGTNDAELSLAAAVQRPQDLADFVVHNESLGADVIIGGKMSINAADFFSSQAVGELLSVARSQYDVVVIDTPPVLMVPDARVIGRLADAIIYVVRWDHTSKVQVTRGLRSLAKIQLKVTGLVLSQIDPKGMKRYGHHDYARSYSYGRS